MGDATVTPALSGKLKDPSDHCGLALNDLPLDTDAAPLGCITTAGEELFFPVGRPG